MIKLRPFNDSNDFARSVSEFLTRYGEKAMADLRASDPTGEAFYQRAVEHLGSQYDQFSRLISLTMNDQSAALAREIVAKIMGNAWMIGTAAAVAPEVKQKMAEQRAADMRKTRSESPAESALMEAIEAGLAGRAVLQPKKEAASILDGVNAKLTAAEHPPVLVDVVYRRLKKLARS